MNTYVISDIHGCARTFEALLQKIRLKKEDQLYLLGDYINKGPDSKGVLDLILHLKKEKFNVSCLRGNHDQMLLDVQLGNVPGSWEHSLEKQHTLQSFQVDTPFEIPEFYLRFLDDLGYYTETEHYFLVHAGFDFRSAFPFRDPGSMLNIKTIDPPKGMLQGKKIVRGHVPQQLTNTLAAIEQSSEVISIDGGCVYYNNIEFGNLWALDLHSLQIVYQPNIDRPYKISIKK